MSIIEQSALNLLSDGAHKNSTQPKITTERLELGVYKIGGVIGLASEGWRTTIKKDDNGEPSISLATEATEGGVIVRTFERGTTTPTDIIGALTLRFDVEVDIPDVEPVVEPA